MPLLFPEKLYMTSDLVFNSHVNRIVSGFRHKFQTFLLRDLFATLFTTLVVATVTIAVITPT